MSDHGGSCGSFLWSSINRVLDTCIDKQTVLTIQYRFVILQCPRATGARPSSFASPRRSIMKPLIFLLCALWRVSGVVIAQGDQPDCVFCYQARDYTCDGSTNCQTLTFTSPCEIDVYLSCAIGCANGVDVNHCRVTATLKHAGGVLPLVECVNWDQDRQAWDEETKTEYSFHKR